MAIVMTIVGDHCDSNIGVADDRDIMLTVNIDIVGDG